jgi:hypothetical protein
MSFDRLFCIVVLPFAFITAYAQEPPMPQLSPGTTRKPAPAAPGPPPVPQKIDLAVPKGTPLQVALDEEVRVRKIGQRVHGKTVEPVYAFDHVVVPVGSEVNGEISKIETLSNLKRTLAALDGDFTPSRKVELTFKELVLADGRHIPLHTIVAPGSGQVIKLVSASDVKQKKGVKDMASAKAQQEKQKARKEWDNAMKQLKTPGKMRRLERYGEEQLPVRPQYIPAATLYFAELQEPLDFGSEIMTPQMASSIAGPIPQGSIVRARLVTPLSSATAKKGEPVEAVLTQPLMEGNRVVLPQGSRLKGAVRDAQPARRFKKNGQLRVAFLTLVPPDGIEQKVQTTLEGVQAGKNANVKLDSEGGAEATNSKSRYMSTAISLGLAAMSAYQEGDRDHDNLSGSDPISRGAGGLGGFKLVGMALGLAVPSRALGYSMGAYGAGMSFYSHFIARGNEVVFPKNTAMQIGIGTRGSGTSAPPASPMQ